MMKNSTKAFMAAIIMAMCLITHAHADSKHFEVSGTDYQATSTASTHAPIGVMGDHIHKQGEWMLSYRYMHMDMDGNRDGTSSISPETIATTEANRFFGVPGQPPTLRVVPEDMTMDMHMIGGMYAPADWVTLMVMGMWQEKEMDHITFQGGAGTNILGSFTTKSDGWGDTKLSGLFRLYSDDTHHAHLNLGVSLPTGSITERDNVLAPNNTRPELRLPYAMQLGSGTFDLLPGLTYYGLQNKWGWGAQYNATIPLESENDEGYSWGDKHELTLWGAYEWERWISTSVRFTGRTQGDIDGIDPQIVAPVQTADPDNYGGDVIEAGLGVNFIVPRGPLANHRFAVEGTVPLYRDLNGPQLETDWSVTAGWQLSF